MNEHQREQYHEGDERFRWEGDPQWGRGRLLPGPWQVQVPSLVPNVVTALGRREAVLNYSRPKIARVPRVQNLTLAAVQAPAPLVANVLFRWEIQIGVGQVSRTFIIDATPFQQVSFSAERVDVSFFVEQIDPVSAAVTTGLVVDASAFLSDGNTSTAPARYTRCFTLGNGTDDQFQIPAGASSWQVFGNTLEVNNAGMLYTVKDPVAVRNFDQLNGSQLLAAHASGGFIPLPGGSAIFDVANATGALSRGSVVFQLEM